MLRLVELDEEWQQTLPILLGKKSLEDKSAVLIGRQRLWTDELILIIFFFFLFWDFLFEISFCKRQKIILFFNFNFFCLGVYQFSWRKLVSENCKARVSGSARDKWCQRIQLCDCSRWILNKWQNYYNPRGKHLQLVIFCFEIFYFIIFFFFDKIVFRTIWHFLFCVFFFFYFFFFFKKKKKK